MSDKRTPLPETIHKPMHLMLSRRGPTQTAPTPGVPGFLFANDEQGTGFCLPVESEEVYQNIARVLGGTTVTVMDEPVVPVVIEK